MDEFGDSNSGGDEHDEELRGCTEEVENSSCRADVGLLAKVGGFSTTLFFDGEVTTWRGVIFNNENANAQTYYQHTIVIGSGSSI